MKKLIKKKVNIFGKGIPVFVIALLGLAIVSAALLPYFGKITGLVTVTSQGLLVDSLSYPNSQTPIAENFPPFTSLESKIFLSLHNLENNADVDADLKLVRTCSVANPQTDGCEDIETTYYTPSMENIIAGADRLVATQNNDGGWDWGTPDGDFGDVSPVNTIGVTALGLLDAYKLTGNETYLNSSIKAYDLIKKNGDNSVEKTNRIRGSDITFLVELSEVTGNLTYALEAKTRYDKVIQDKGNANGLAIDIRDEMVGSYPGLVSWDINFYVQGALALDRYYPDEEYDTDADAMTEVIYDFMSTHIFDGNEAAYGLSLAGAIESYATTGLHPAEKNSLVMNLISRQDEASGCFADPQTTAYAIMALLEVNEKDSVINASACLINLQNDNGGWFDGGEEYTEIGSEAIQTGLFTEIIESTSFTVPAGKKLNFVISNYFPQMMKPAEYTITTIIDTAG